MLLNLLFPNTVYILHKALVFLVKKHESQHALLKVKLGLLNDGDEIEIGNRKLTIYHTPVHSPGHISILDNSTGDLFTGDLLYDGTPVYTFFPTTNPVDLTQSLKKISNIPKVTKIYGGHNTIGLDASLLQEVGNAVEELKEKDQVRFGTGIHKFKGFSVQF